MGFVIAPMPAIVLARVKPEHAAAASGVLSTAQQAGGSIGVAVIGSVFYSALGGGSYPRAFELSLVVMAAFGLAVADGSSCAAARSTRWRGRGPAA